MTQRTQPPRDSQSLAVLATVRDLLRYAVSRFEHAGLSFGHGTDNSFDEAAWLVLWSLNLPLDRLEVFADARVTTAERDAVLALIELRCDSRRPLAYLTGEAWLRGRRFRSDERALVPRSLIAEALDTVLDDWLDAPPSTVLDLCTGGGSLAVLAAQHWPQSLVTGSDLSSDALALAADNVALHGLTPRVTLVRGDLFGALGDTRFDLILCNPPYVSQASIDALPPEFRAEPAGALAGGLDGMDLVRRIIAAAPVHLNDEGVLLLEIGHEADHFERAFPELEFTYLPVTSGDDRLALIRREALAP